MCISIFIKLRILICPLTLPNARGVKKARRCLPMLTFLDGFWQCLFFGVWVWLLLLAVVLFARFLIGSLASLFIVVYWAPVRWLCTALPWVIVCCIVEHLWNWWDPFLCNRLFSMYLLGWVGCIISFWNLCQWVFCFSCLQLGSILQYICLVLLVV